MLSLYLVQFRCAAGPCFIVDVGDDVVKMRIVLEIVRIFTMAYAKVAVMVDCSHVLEPLGNGHLLSDVRRDQMVGLDVVSFQIRLSVTDHAVGSVLLALA